MFKNALLLCCISACLISCDVRNHDKIASTNPLNKQVEIKDPTTVKVLDTLYNFGNIKEGEIVNCSFRFVNTGTKPLIITDTKAQCGCTVPERPTEPIKPGDTSVIKATFNSAGKEGHTNKTITVISNTEPAFPTLLITGEIEKKKD